MGIDEWMKNLEKAVLVKLEDLDSERELRILDVGVFPWDSLIEISALYADDPEDCAYEDDVACWINYNFSEQQEGAWPEVEALAESLGEAYEEDASSQETFFKATAKVMAGQAITDALKAKTLATDFRITVLDPDDPDTNYMENGE